MFMWVKKEPIIQQIFELLLKENILEVIVKSQIIVVFCDVKEISLHLKKHYLLKIYNHIYKI